MVSTNCIGTELRCKSFFFAFPDLCDTKEPFRQKFTIIMMRYSVVSGNLQMQIINFHPTHCAK